MSNNNPNIEQLDYAITSLNDDAESMHSLITRSTDELERATAEGKRAADLAAETAEALTSSLEKMESTSENVSKLISDTEKANEKLSADIKTAQEEGRESFENFSAASLKSLDQTRDALQTDFLSHKTAMAARMDGLENTLTQLSKNIEKSEQTFDEKATALQDDLLSHKTAMAERLDGLEKAVTQLSKDIEKSEQSLDEKMATLQKKVALPLYGVIAVGILQLITLAALFLR